MGDSLLSQIVTLHLDREFPRDQYPPGVLTRIRAKVVADETLRSAAKQIGLDSMAIDLAPADRQTQARTVVSTGKPLASMFEALIAACWRHHGAEATSAAVIDCLAAEIDAAAASPVELKSMLQELLAKSGATVRYEASGQSGPPHAPMFEVVAVIDPDGREIASGRGGSKKAAEADAAAAALAILESEGG